MNYKLLFSVRDILTEIYSDEIDEIIKKLDEYKLREVVDHKLEYLKSRTEIKNQLNIDLNAFSVSLIKSINDVVLNLMDLNDKVYLKYVLADIGKYIINSLIQNDCIRINELLELEKTLKSASEIEDYNYEDIERLLQLRLTINSQPSIKSTIENKTNKVVYYEWLSKDYILLEIANNLKSENSISSVRSFKKLFTNEPEKVNFNKSSKEFILILFDVLREQKQIKPRGNKGHFVPLKRHAVDLENNFLYEKEMKTIKNTIKKNKVKYLKLKNKAENWVTQL